MCRDIFGLSRSESEAFRPKSVVHAQGVWVLGGGVLYTPHLLSLLNSIASEALRLRTEREGVRDVRHNATLPWPWRLISCCHDCFSGLPGTVSDL